MAKQVLFRGALGGYNKKDVNEYLISKAKETKELLALRDEQIKELSEKLGKAEGFAAERERLLKEKVKGSADALNTELDALKAKLDELFSIVNELDSEIEKGAQNAAKAAKYDRLALTLGDMFSIDPKKEELELAAPADRSEMKAAVLEKLKKLEDGLHCLGSEDL